MKENNFKFVLFPVIIVCSVTLRCFVVLVIKTRIYCCKWKYALTHCSSECFISTIFCGKLFYSNTDIFVFIYHTTYLLTQSVCTVIQNNAFLFYFSVSFIDFSFWIYECFYIVSAQFCRQTSNLYERFVCILFTGMFSRFCLTNCFCSSPGNTAKLTFSFLGNDSRNMKLANMVQYINEKGNPRSTP